MRFDTRRLRKRSAHKWLPCHLAEQEITQALNVPGAVAQMMLYGLIATGNILAATTAEETIHPEQCTIAEFEGKAALVEADDLRHWLQENSPAPLTDHRDRVIEAMLSGESNPPRNIPWKKFCDAVRNKCNGWHKDKPALGFGDKQIQRIVKGIRDR